MAHTSRALPMLLIIILGGLFGLSALRLSGNFAGSITSPSAPIIFNPQASTFSYKLGNSQVSTTSCTGINCPGSWTDTVVTTPIGGSATTFSAQWCNYLGFCSPTETWYASLPAAANGYGATFTLTGPQLVTQNSGQCSGSPSDCINYPIGNSTGPPSICPSGGCYQIVKTFTSTKTNSSGTYTTTATTTWYVYRFVFSLIITINFSSSTISVACANVSNNACPQVTLCAAPFVCQDMTSYFIANLQNWVSRSANPVAHLTSSTVSVQINTPLSYIQSNLDWFTIYGAWIGGQGPQTSGACTSGGASCFLGIGAHGVLGLYSDPGLTQGAFPTSTSSFPSFLQSYSLNQLQNILPSNSHNTVYTSLPITDYGLGFSVAANCRIDSMNNCFSSTGSITTTVPIIYDVIGSKTTFVGNYQPAPAQVACYCQTVYGRILDGNSPLGFLGLYNPLPGVLVSLTNVAGTVNGNQASVTNSTGWFTLYNVALPTGGSQTVSLYVTANGYNNAQFQVALSVNGPSVNAGNYLLQPSAAGQTCILPPVPNPVPGLPPLFPGICVSTGVLVAVFILTGLALATVITVYTGGFGGGGRTLGLAKSAVGAVRKK